jgi:hypothetical protein
VILMPVIPEMGEDHVGNKFPLEDLELVFNLSTAKGKEAVTIALDLHVLLSGFFQEGIRTLARLVRSLLVGAKYDPANLYVFIPLQKTENCPTATDFDIVAMRSQAQHAQQRPGRQPKAQPNHC